MNEGWQGDDYLILFAESEIPAACERYTISELLPGLQILGLRGWDDFIVRDAHGQTYSVPTGPARSQYLAPFSLSNNASVLEPDRRFEGKIKWYTKPVAFGGDPKLGENLVWVTHEQHAQLLRWWNSQYLSAVARKNPNG